MRIKRVRFFLWLTVAALAGGSAAVIVTSTPPPSSATPPVTAAPGPPPEAMEPNLPALAELELLCQRDLQRPLFDAPPPPPPVAAPPPPPPSLPFKLAGTVVELGHCRAMLQQPDGSIQFKAVGDIVAGAQIMQIARDSVTVKYAGRSMVLKLEKKEGSGPPS